MEGRTEYIVRFKGDYSALAKDLNKIGAVTKKLEDDEVIIKLAYDGNIKEFNKTFDKISKLHPELGIQFQYNVNEKLLNQETDKLKKLTDLKLDIDENQVKTKLEGLKNNIEVALDQGMSKDEITRRVNEYFGYFNTAIKAGAKNINQTDFNELTDQLFGSFEKQSREIQDILNTIWQDNQDKRIELFHIDKGLNDDISTAQDRVNDLNDAMEKLEKQGASKLGLPSEAKKLEDEIKILKSDIEDMQGQLQNLSGEKFEEITEQVRNLNDELSRVLSKLGMLNNSALKDISTFLTSFGKVKPSEIDKYIERIKKSFDSLDEKTKMLLKDLGLLNSEGGITPITDGANNLGGLIGEKNIVKVSHSTTTSIENVRKLKEVLDEAYEAGVNCVRIVDAVEAGKDTVIELQTTMKGNVLQNNDFSFDLNALKASDEQLQKLYLDMKKLWDLGIAADINPSNYIFDPTKGFGIIDLDFKDNVSDATYLYDSFDALWNDFLETIKDNIDGTDEGKLVDSFYSNLTNAISKIKDTAKEATKEAAEEIRKSQDSNSPAELTKPLGKDFGEGYAEGIREAMPDIVKACREIVLGAYNAIKEISASDDEELKASTNGFSESFINIFRTKLEESIPTIQEEIKGIFSKINIADGNEELFKHLGEGIIEPIVEGLRNANSGESFAKALESIINDAFSKVVLNIAAQGLVNEIQNYLDLITEQKPFRITHFDADSNSLVVSIQNALNNSTFNINLDGTVKDLSTALNTSAENVRLTFIDAVKWMREANEIQKNNKATTRERIIFYNSETGEFSNPTVIGENNSINSDTTNALLKSEMHKGKSFDTNLHWHQDWDTAVPSPDDLIYDFVNAYKNGITKFIVGAQKDLYEIDFSKIANSEEELVQKVKEYLTENINEVATTFKDYFSTSHKHELDIGKTHIADLANLEGLDSDQILRVYGEYLAIIFNSEWNKIAEDLFSNGIVADTHDKNNSISQIAGQQALKHIAQKTLLNNSFTSYTNEQFEQKYGANLPKGETDKSTQLPLTPTLPNDFKQQLQDLIDASGKYMVKVYGELVTTFKQQLQEDINKQGEVSIEITPFIRKGGLTDELNSSQSSTNNNGQLETIKMSLESFKEELEQTFKDVFSSLNIDGQNAELFKGIGQELIDAIIVGIQNEQSVENFSNALETVITNACTKMILNCAAEVLLNKIQLEMNNYNEENPLHIDYFNPNTDNLVVSIQDALNKKTFNVNLGGTIQQLATTLDTSAENVRLTFIDAIRWMKDANDLQVLNKEETRERQLFFNTKTGQFSNPVLIGDTHSIKGELSRSLLANEMSQGKTFDTDLHWHQDFLSAAPSPQDLLFDFVKAYEDGITKFVVGAQNELTEIDFSKIAKNSQELTEKARNFLSNNIESVKVELENFIDRNGLEEGITYYDTESVDGIISDTDANVRRLYGQYLKAILDSEWEKLKKDFIEKAQKEKYDDYTGNASFFDFTLLQLNKNKIGDAIGNLGLTDIFGESKYTEALSKEISSRLDFSNFSDKFFVSLMTDVRKGIDYTSFDGSLQSIKDVVEETFENTVDSEFQEILGNKFGKFKEFTIQYATEFIDNLFTDIQTKLTKGEENEAYQQAGQQALKNIAQKTLLNGALSIYSHDEFEEKYGKGIISQTTTPISQLGIQPTIPEDFLKQLQTIIDDSGKYVIKVYGELVEDFKNQIQSAIDKLGLFTAKIEGFPYSDFHDGLQTTIDFLGNYHVNIEGQLISTFKEVLQQLIDELGVFTIQVTPDVKKGGEVNTLDNNEVESDIDKPYNALVGIMDRIKQSSISDKDLFTWIKENATDAEKELLGVSKSFEEFQKFLFGLNSNSKGLFQYEKGFDDDYTLFYFNDNAIDAWAKEEEERVNKISELLKTYRETYKKNLELYGNYARYDIDGNERSNLKDIENQLLTLGYSNVTSETPLSKIIEEENELFFNNSKIEETSNDTIRAIDDIGLTEEALIKKIQLENEEVEKGNQLFKERVSLIRNGVVVDSVIGKHDEVDGNVLDWNLDYDKILHTHPIIDADPSLNMFSYNDISTFFDHALESGKEFELFWNNQILKLQLPNSLDSNKLYDILDEFKMHQLILMDELVDEEIPETKVAFLKASYEELDRLITSIGGHTELLNASFSSDTKQATELGRLIQYWGNVNNNFKNLGKEVNENAAYFNTKTGQISSFVEGGSGHLTQEIIDEAYKQAEITIDGAIHTHGDWGKAAFSVTDLKTAYNDVLRGIKTQILMSMDEVMTLDLNGVKGYDLADIITQYEVRAEEAKRKLEDEGIQDIDILQVEFQKILKELFDAKGLSEHLQLVSRQDWMKLNPALNDFTPSLLRVTQTSESPEDIEATTKAYISKKDAVQQLREQLNLTKKAAEELVDANYQPMDNGKFKIDQESLNQLIASKKESSTVEGSATTTTTALSQEDELFKKIVKSAQNASDAKKEFAEANEKVLQSIVNSLVGLNSEGDGFNNLNKIINNLANNKEDRITNMVKNLKELRDLLNGQVNSDSIISTLKDMAAQGENLKELAKVLSAGKKAIDSAKDATKSDGKTKKDSDSSIKKEVKSAEKDLSKLGKRVGKLGNQELTDQFNSIKTALKDVGDDADKLKAVNQSIEDLTAKTTKAETETDNLAKDAKRLTENYKELKSLQNQLNGSKEDGKKAEEIQKRIDALKAENKALENNKYTKEQQQAIDKAQSDLNIAIADTEDKKAEATRKSEEATKKAEEAEKRAMIAHENRRNALLLQASELLKNGKISANYGIEIKKMIGELSDTEIADRRLGEIANRFKEIKTQANLAGKSGKTLFQMIKGRATSLVSYLGTFASFYRIISYIRTAFTTIKELDTQLVDLRKTTTMTTSELNEFYYASNKIAKQLGVTTSEIISQAAAWSRLGYSSKEAAVQMAEISSTFASISPGMTTDNSTDYLVSTMQAYGINVDEVQRKVLDNVNAIGKKLPKHTVTYGVILNLVDNYIG